METNIKTGTDVNVYFNEAIFKGLNFNKIKVTDLKTHRSVSMSKTVNGNILTLNKLKTGHVWYSVSIPQGSVRDKAGNQFKSGYVLKFKTV